MISLTTEVALLSLIRAGRFSEREIARKAGVARGTVRKYKAAHARQGAERNPAIFEPGEPDTIGRCARCGAKVVFPCRACELRRQLGTDLD